MRKPKAKLLERQVVVRISDQMERDLINIAKTEELGFSATVRMLLARAVRINGTVRKPNQTT
jgi:hypothetical protein